MSTYRTGGHWRRTIVRVGTQPPDADGRRPDDELAGVMDDPALAERIVWLLDPAYSTHDLISALVAEVRRLRSETTHQGCV